MTEAFEVSPATWIACPMDDCGKTSKGWSNTVVHCSDCGDHPGVQCPACEVVIDVVHHELQEMIDAAVPPYRAAPGVYCGNGHTGKPVMVCDDCKAVWSPCCGESHECAVDTPTVPGSGALFPTRVDRLFRRGQTVKVKLGPELGKISVMAGPEHDLADWPGWE